LKLTKNFLAHYSQRKAGTKVSIIILHYISAINVDPDDAYNPIKIIDILNKYKLSAHFLITREGEVVQLVPEMAKAWHAGKSKWKGKRNLNEHSIGIEIIGMDGDKFTEDQYKSVIELCMDLKNRYDIKEENIIGHSDVSPGRKRDIGRYWSFPRLYDALYRPKPGIVSRPVKPEPSLISKGTDQSGLTIFLQKILSIFTKGR